MRDDEPNWGLAFGCGSFLIVWCLAFFAGVPYDVMLLRAGISAVLGFLLGVMVGYTLSGLKSLRDDLDNKGARVDFMVGDDEPLMPRPMPEREPSEDVGETREAVVPQAAAVETDPFKPIDYKSAAKQIKQMVQE